MLSMKLGIMLFLKKMAMRMNPADNTNTDVPIKENNFKELLENSDNDLNKD